jgi:hypothetical protein
MSLDEAVTLAGQVLAGYEASGMAGAPGAERIWAGRLAGALRHLAAQVNGAVVLSSAEADTVWQALADAAWWRAQQAASGPVHARDEAIAAEYAALRGRLGGDRR